MKVGVVEGDSGVDKNTEQYARSVSGTVTGTRSESELRLESESRSILELRLESTIDDL